MTELLSQYPEIEWIIISLEIGYVISVLSAIVVVISENRNPVKSLAWVIVLLMVPVLGLVLYIVFGRNVKNKHYISKRSRRQLKRNEPAKPFNAAQSGLSDSSAMLVRLGHSLVDAPYYEHNDAVIINNGVDKFEMLFDDIRKAEKYIYIQYYIIRDDEIGTRFGDLLIEKARQGVSIKIIYDHVGSFPTSNKYFKRLRKAGIEVYPFLRVYFPFMGSRINWRNHRKLCVIDGKAGYIGGMNVADHYLNGGKRFNGWRDEHLRVTGPILHSLINAFAADWNFMGKPLPTEYLQCEIKPSKENFGMQLVTSGPNAQWSNIALIFMKAIGGAKRSIYLQTPYFLPNEGLLRALQAAALSKVDVRVMIPRHSDTPSIHYGSLSYVKECLMAGVKFYFYEKGMIHSKVLIVDDEFVSVGSTNFDFRSFEHNFEGNLFVYSKEFNQRMTNQFLADEADSTLVELREWDRRPFTNKIKESLMRLLAPIL